MPATAVKTYWKNGDLYFADKSGNEIFHIDGANRALVMHASAGFTAPLEVDATDIAAGAVTYDKVTLTAGNILAGTKTTNIASLLDISAAGAIAVGQGAGETPLAKTLSGDVTMASTGAVTIAAKAVENTMIAAAAGTVLVGTKTSGDVTALDISAEGALPVGQGAGETAKAYAMSGDVTMTKGGVTAIGSAKVTNAMLASGAGVGAIVTAGLGNSAAYAKTTDGAQTLVALNAAKARGTLVIAVVDESFADNAGNQPTFAVGETDTPNACWAAGTFTGATAGTIFTKGFLNTANKAIIVTAAKAIGLGAGGLSVTALALPNS